MVNGQPALCVCSQQQAAEAERVTGELLLETLALPEGFVGKVYDASNSQVVEAADD